MYEARVPNSSVVNRNCETAYKTDSFIAVKCCIEPPTFFG